jgi:Mg-chelatase subunit ChlD
MSTRTASTTKKTTTRSKKTAAATKKSATKKPAAKKPATKKPAAKKPAAKKPAAKKPAAKKPATKKPAAKKVAAKKVAAKKPVAKPVAPKASSRGKKDLAALAKQAGEAAASGALVNHVVFVIDRSGSMGSIRQKVVSVFNSQLAEVKKNAEATGQATFVTLYTFHSTVDAPRFFAKPIAQVEKLGSISTTGATALLDATGQAIVDLQGVPGASADNVSFIILVLTDGYENNSRKYKTKIQSMIKAAQDSGRWTFAFLTPKGGEAALLRFGIPAGNIQTWSTAGKGVQTMGQDLQRGLQTFYDARQKGQRAVVGVFTTNLAQVSVEAVSSSMTDSTDAFVRIPVATASAIRPLVEAELKTKDQSGNGYYELTKPELVQEYKEIAIVDKASGKIYAGDAARTHLGLPIGSRIKVKPGDHGAFAIFVQSTSVNRKLVAGTTLLYKKV